MATESWQTAEVPQKGIKVKYPPGWGGGPLGEKALIFKPQNQAGSIKVINSNAYEKSLEQIYQEQVQNSIQSFDMDYRDVNSTPGSQPRVDRLNRRGKNFIRIEGTYGGRHGTNDPRTYQLWYLTVIDNRFCEFDYIAPSTNYQQSLQVAEQMFNTVEFSHPVNA